MTFQEMTKRIRSSVSPKLDFRTKRSKGRLLVGVGFRGNFRAFALRGEAADRCEFKHFAPLLEAACAEMVA